MPVNIQEPARQVPFSIFVLGFRPFFLVAGVFAVLAMSLWTAVYSLGVRLPWQGLAAFHWHAHEMLFGFTLAVVSGFLLTAIRNWTGIQTLHGRGLLALVSLWGLARLLILAGEDWLLAAMITDLAYNLFLFFALWLPIWRVRQWKQAGILSKILLLGVCNGLFYLGLMGHLDLGLYWGLTGGLYLLIALVMTMGRRVMPGFIENGVAYPVRLTNSRLLDVTSLVLFLAFALSDLFLLHAKISGALAAGLAVVSLWRLVNWHTPGIWKEPLLWGLYVAFMFITLGFLLFAVQPYSAAVSRSIALHAFTFGGIGLITMSMMSRVTLGHTGRDIRQPFRFTGLAQGFIVVGALIRIFPPLLWPDYHATWILLAQGLWILGFVVFVLLYSRPLIQARIDGRNG